MPKGEGWTASLGTENQEGAPGEGSRGKELNPFQSIPGGQPQTGFACQHSQEWQGLRQLQGAEGHMPE